jgi:hypothetical protein
MPKIIFNTIENLKKISSISCNINIVEKYKLIEKFENSLEILNGKQ